MLSKGQKINDRYEIIKSIGEGGMANVYLAKDKILDRKVAIKVLRGDLSGDEKFIRRFQREALSVSNLSHPNIVEVYDVGEEEGQHYIVMEYIEGKTLKQLIQKRGALTIEEVIDIMGQITDGLAHAHEAYIIHRDIKPQNIMILDNGTIKITDFGIAMALNATQLTQTNSVMGSVHYLPPEQANGKGSTVKSDIYSAGILMYELLTGSVPFKGDTAVEIALKHMKDKMPSIRKQNPLIPQSVENIVLRATAKNPKNRYDSAREMHNDLVKALDNPDEKRITYEYPENDLDDTKVMPTITKPKKTVEKVKAEQDENEEIIETIEKKDKNRILITLASVLLTMLIVAGIFYLIIANRDVKDVRVPDVVGLTTEKAIQKLKSDGFKYTTETIASDTVEEGKVVKTSPKAGSSKKKGSTITIYESSGDKYALLEDYTGKDYAEVKAKLELLGINVLVEKKAVDNAEDYRDKADLIIDQTPKYVKAEKEEDTQKLKKGDNVTLYIPNIAETYPDMVAEGWTLSEAQAFADEYGVTLDVTYKETGDFPADTVIKQGRPAGDRIVSGITLKITVAKDPASVVLPENKVNP